MKWETSAWAFQLQQSANLKPRCSYDVKSSGTWSFSPPRVGSGNFEPLQSISSSGDRQTHECSIEGIQHVHEVGWKKLQLYFH